MHVGWGKLITDQPVFVRSARVHDTHPQFKHFGLRAREGISRSQSIFVVAVEYPQLLLASTLKIEVFIIPFTTVYVTLLLAYPNLVS
jgi:hypothetical protein